ncbi:MAG TPA: ParB/RepB/Spo0J family partition protein [Syntrophomonadaceae bacterium]|nr:ParB/RepB/Spo0J family partition protein [Syntrophomonadaceae bacterium]
MSEHIGAIADRMQVAAYENPYYGSADPEEEPATQGTCMVPIEKLYPNPANPRKKFDQEALDKLTESIRQVGVLEPILVVADGDRYRIVAGERRWRAAKTAGLKEVPVIIRDLTPEQEFEVMLTENLQRQDLDPIEEAIAFKAAIDRGWKQVDLAAKLGISQELISNRMRLLKLPESVQENISRGILSAGHGLALLKVAHQPKLVKNLMEKLNGVPVASAEKIIDDYIYSNNYSTPLCSGQGWRSPKFDPDKEGCAKCQDRVLIRTSPNAEHRHPYCLNRKCWEKKQQIAEEAEKEQAKSADYILDLKKLPCGSYEYFFIIAVEDCAPCEHIKDALDWDKQIIKVCMNPDCMREKKEAIRQAEIDKKNAELEAFNKQKRALINGFNPYVSVCRKHLVYMVAMAVRSPYNIGYAQDTQEICEEIYKFFGWHLPENLEDGDKKKTLIKKTLIKDLVSRLMKEDNFQILQALFIAMLLPVDANDEVYKLTLGAQEEEVQNEKMPVP